jgi:hypothetical protein
LKDINVFKYCGRGDERSNHRAWSCLVGENGKVLKRREVEEGRRGRVDEMKERR